MKKKILMTIIMGVALNFVVTGCVSTSTRYVDVKQATPLWWKGKKITTAQPGETLRILSSQKCWKSDDTCLTVFDESSGQKGIVSEKMMQMRNSIYKLDEQKNKISQPLPVTHTIQVETPTNIYLKGKVMGIAQPGDNLKVVGSKTCKSGKGTCWWVKSEKEDIVGIVSAKKMTRTNKVYDINGNLISK